MIKNLNRGGVIGLAVAVLGFGCAVYFQITGTVPGVILFVPIGDLATRAQEPTVFYAWVTGHVIVGLIGTVIFVVSLLVKRPD